MIRLPAPGYIHSECRGEAPNSLRRSPSEAPAERGERPDGSKPITQIMERASLLTSKSLLGRSPYLPMWLSTLLILAFIAPAMLAKRKGRRNRRYLRGNVESSQALGTLASNTLVAAAIGSTVEERTLISSIVLAWALKDLTEVVSDGPVIVGVAHSDYTAAEIEEVIENTGGWSEGNLVAQEVAKRRVRIVGIFEELGGDTTTATLQEGKMIKTKLNWILTTGQTIDIWAYNAGASGLTGTAQLHVFGHANLWPR